MEQPAFAQQSCCSFKHFKAMIKTFLTRWLLIPEDQILWPVISLCQWQAQPSPPPNLPVKRHDATYEPWVKQYEPGATFGTISSLKCNHHATLGLCVTRHLASHLSEERGGSSTINSGQTGLRTCEVEYENPSYLRFEYSPVC